MLNRIVVASIFSGAAIIAWPVSSEAQSNKPSQTQSPPAAGAPSAGSNTKPAAGADLRKLIGTDVKNAANESIGEIESVFVRPDGTVDGVMVSVGGFLGMGEREVKVGWNDLKISQNGEKVTVNMTRDQLKAMPEYKYPDRRWRGQVFTERGPWIPDRSRDRAGWEQFNSFGHVAGSAVIGASVRNQNRETLGEVEEIYVGKDGKIEEVIVAVGGFLGVGEKNIAMKWNDLRFDREGDDLVVRADWTRDKLKAMPDRRRNGQEQAEKPGR